MSTSSGSRRRVPRLLVLPLMLVLTMLGTGGVASAERYYTNGGAAKAARQWIASHYTVDYYDLTASCRGKNTSGPNASYKYRHNVCTVVDHSDDTYIMVQITGQAGRESYTAMRLTGWREI